MHIQRGSVERPDDPVETDDTSTGLTWRRVGAEDEILAVLAAPRASGEQHDSAFRRKEHQLGDIFAALGAVDSLELQRRITLRLPGDQLALRFAQLTSDRRARLIAFLISSRRRFAIAPRESSDE